jgi:hypothetical protein
MPLVFEDDEETTPPKAPKKTSPDLEAFADKLDDLDGELDPAVETPPPPPAGEPPPRKAMPLEDIPLSETTKYVMPSATAKDPFRERPRLYLGQYALIKVGDAVALYKWGVTGRKWSYVGGISSVTGEVDVEACLSFIRKNGPELFELLGMASVAQFEVGAVLSKKNLK